MDRRYMNGTRFGDAELWQDSSLGDGPDEPPAAYRKLLLEASRRWETKAAHEVSVQQRRAENRDAASFVFSASAERGGSRKHASKNPHAEQPTLWPRPRLFGLILVMSLGLSVPDVVLRLLIWAVVLFLVASVSIGPERARDLTRSLWRRFTCLWVAEIALVGRFVQRQRQRLTF